MSIELLKKRAKESNIVETLPRWVTAKNQTHSLYESMRLLEKEKKAHIKSASTKTLFKKKSSYQISVSELSRATGLANPTISHTSAYSKELMLTLNSINNDLAKKRETKIKKIESRMKKGVQAGTKNEITDKLKETKNQLDYLSKLNAAEQVTELVDKLSLPIKRKLGLN